MRGPVARATDQQVPKLAGVPSADDELLVADDHRAAAGVHPHLSDVRQRDQQRAVDPHETGVAPLGLEGRQRAADEVAAVGGVQPCVVAVRLDVPHVGAVDEPGDAAELDRDLVLGALGLATVEVADASHGLGEPVLAHRLEHVVDRVELEGVDGVVVVRRDEHDRRRGAEPGQHAGELQPGQAGHADVGEDRVDAPGLQHPQRLGGVVGRGDAADARVALEQPGELVESGPLVVDDEHAQRRGSRAGHECTPGAYLGTRTITLVPAAGAVSTTKP